MRDLTQSLGLKAVILTEHVSLTISTGANASVFLVGEERSGFNAVGDVLWSMAACLSGDRREDGGIDEEDGVGAGGEDTGSSRKE